MKKGKGISRKYIYRIDTDNSVVIARGKGGWGYVEVGKGEEMRMERDFAWGDEHMMCKWCFVELYT